MPRDEDKRCKSLHPEHGASHVSRLTAAITMMPRLAAHSTLQISFRTCSRAFPLARFVNLPSHKALRTMLVTGTLAHGGQPRTLRQPPQPLMSTAMRTLRQTPGDASDASDGEDFVLQRSRFVKRDFGRSSPVL
jgi:hypothetical protein